MKFKLTFLIEVTIEKTLFILLKNTEKNGLNLGVNFFVSFVDRFHCRSFYHFNADTSAYVLSNVSFFEIFEMF